MHPTVLVGARAHNLKGIDLEIAPGEVVLVTGVSGSGKSSLALDTLYAEGQRRFVESFSPYARQFLDRLERPDVERLEPVPAGVAVDRRAPVKSSRSTVATMADLEPYLSALFVRESVPVCPEHEVPAVELDAQGAAAQALHQLKEERATLTYPMRLETAEQYLEVREQLAQEGYRRLWVDGAVRDMDDVKPSSVVGVDKDLEVVVDRIAGGGRAEREARLAAAIELAWQRSGGEARVHALRKEFQVRAGLGCPRCGHRFAAPRAGLFSYESPLGACARCKGFGRVMGIDLGKVFPDPSKTLSNHAIRPWNGKSTRWERAELAKFCRRQGISMDVPWGSHSAAHQELILEGDGSWDTGMFPGVKGWYSWLETRTYKMHVRVLLSRYRSYDPCPECQGRRLTAQALAYRVAGRDIATWHALEIRDACSALRELTCRTGQGELIRKELLSRLTYLERVGLGHLTLDRQARTLSGGEAQRVILTAALGTSLHNALFVLDEPSVGLHPADVAPLAGLIRELAQRQNTVLVIEHDPALISAADRVIELGPGSGSSGGQLVADGSLAEVVAAGGATHRALARAPWANRVRRAPKSWLEIRGAKEHNLKGIDIRIPLGVICAVTGPSGSGKSSLVIDILGRQLARDLGDLDQEPAGAHHGLSGHDGIKDLVLVDQSPLGRTSRGNAATYTGAWDVIRRRFAGEPAAEAMGLTPGHFSFNVAAGRCEACSGEGHETVEMQFLADVHLVCPVCKGRRFQEPVLRVRHRNIGVGELLESTVDQAADVFKEDIQVVRALAPVQLLGLGYLRLGQALSTLSGGEAQRLKLARALREKHAGALFILDEPSAGLHADEIGRVVRALDTIVQGGGSVVVVDHDLGIVEAADWIIDLGPGAGRAGGQLVAHGTPEELARLDTLTGRALRALREPAKKMASGTKRGRRSGPAGGISDAPALHVEKAREHNLREVTVSIPHGALTVVTGPSGSGKSTLAFDVVFAEGQRRFLETLTPYARQFLPTLPRPDVDRVYGIPPSIALEQRTSRAGPKSTVATVTELAHYLRLLFAKLGIPRCPEHGRPIQAQRVERVLEQIRACSGRAELLAPAVVARKGIYLDLFTAASRENILEAYVDGERVNIDPPPRLARNKEHTIDLVLQAGRASGFTLVELERALRWGQGSVKLRRTSGEEQLHSTVSACPECGLSVPELDPRWFSFNTRQGRCERCEGDGVIVETRVTRAGKKKVTREVSEVCPECGGARLAPIPRAVQLQERTYAEISAESVDALFVRVQRWVFSVDHGAIAKPVVKELERRLQFLRDVGLGYLSLDRAARTLSGGEIQRLRLAAQLGAGLTGALYVLDEPTIGLHPRDTRKLLDNLRRLVATGSTVLVVEHDVDTIRAADHLIDLGPGGGLGGGQVMAEGTPAQVLQVSESPTGRALSRAPSIRESLDCSGKSLEWLTLEGVQEHNLKDVTLQVPMGRLSVVAGVSGSGKSTLVRRVLLPAVRQRLGLETELPGKHRTVRGGESLRRAIAVDQSPIGRTPRSVPATFLGIWDLIRQLFAATPEAMVAGFGPARFSFNTAQGGRCTNCDGQGVITHEMSFLPDVTTPCPVCEGARFEPRTRAIRYLGHDISGVLDLTAERAAQVFANHPRIAAPLSTLVELGAGYIRLGQGSHTLSGGEAQRLKLAAEVSATSRHEATLYVLDEPTTGLHLADVEKLVSVLSRLVVRGDTLVVIEHHPLVIAGADHLVELGPEGGANGGDIVAWGTPNKVARRRTPTGLLLRELLL